MPVDHETVEAAAEPVDVREEDEDDSAFLEEIGVPGERAADVDFTPSIRMAPDGGGILPEKAENLALHMADGFTKSVAWRMVGGRRKNERYGRTIREHPVFKARLQILVEEKMRAQDQGLAGDVMWAVRQNWRLARATADVAQIHRATVLLVETAKSNFGGGAAIEGEVSSGEEKRAPGRPPHQPRSTKPDVASMKATLQRMGVKEPAPAEDA